LILPITSKLRRAPGSSAAAGHQCEHVPAPQCALLCTDWAIWAGRAPPPVPRGALLASGAAAALAAGAGLLDCSKGSAGYVLRWLELSERLQLDALQAACLCFLQRCLGSSTRQMAALACDQQWLHKLSPVTLAKVGGQRCRPTPAPVAARRSQREWGGKGGRRGVAAPADGGLLAASSPACEVRALGAWRSPSARASAAPPPPPQCCGWRSTAPGSPPGCRVTPCWRRPAAARSCGWRAGGAPLRRRPRPSPCRAPHRGEPAQPCIAALGRGWHDGAPAPPPPPDHHPTQPCCRCSFSEAPRDGVSGYTCRVCPSCQLTVTPRAGTPPALSCYGRRPLVAGAGCAGACGGQPTCLAPAAPAGCCRR
jgi:hypothetical protein